MHLYEGEMMKLVSISDYESQKAFCKPWQSVEGGRMTRSKKKNYVLCLLYDRGKERQITLAQLSSSIVQSAIQTGELS